MRTTSEKLANPSAPGSFMASLADLDRRALRAAGVVRRVRAGEWIAPDDEPLSDLVLIDEGRVRLLRRDALLRAPVPVVLGPGAAAGADARPDALRVGLRAIDDARVLVVRARAWDMLAARAPTLAAALDHLRERGRLAHRAAGALRSSPVLGGASLPELHGLVERAELRSWGSLEHFHTGGAPLASVLVLLEGAVFVRDALLGATVRLLTAGDVVGDLTLVSGRPMPFDLVAGSRGCRVLEIPHAVVLEALRETPPFRRAILAGGYGDHGQRQALLDRVFGDQERRAEVVLFDTESDLALGRRLAGWVAASLRRQFRERVMVVQPGDASGPAQDGQGVVWASAPLGQPLASGGALRSGLRRADLVILVGGLAWRGDADRVLDLEQPGVVPRSLPVAHGCDDLPPALQPAVDRWARALTGRRVGIALSGGGALALGHWALLEAIEAAELPVDLVTGVSGGAVVGSVYAAHGLAGRQILGQVCSGLPSRVARSWLSSRSVAHLLDHQLERARLEDLDLAFYPVATDIDRGVQVHLETGSVGQGVRASGAFPGTFGPACLQAAGRARRLVDGGIVNLVADDTAVLMGARVVLASNVVATPRPRGPRPGRLAALGRRLDSRSAQRLRQLDPRLRVDDLLRAASELLQGSGDFERRPVDVRFRAAPAPYAPTDWARWQEIIAWHHDDPDARRRIQEAVDGLHAAVTALRWKHVKRAPRSSGDDRVSVAMTRLGRTQV